MSTIKWPKDGGMTIEGGSLTRSKDVTPKRRKEKLNPEMTWEKTWDKTWERTWDKTWDSTWEKTWDRTWEKT